jgi:signal transduction histidine kinase
LSAHPKADIAGTRFGAPGKLREVLTSIARSARSAAGPRAKVRLFLVPDPHSRPVSALSESSDGLRKASPARGVVLKEGKPLRVDLDDSSDLVVAVLPLASRSEIFGVLEVVASSAALTSAWKALKGVADQGGLALRMLIEAAALHAGLAQSQALARLAHSLVRTRSTNSAVEEVAQGCYDRFGVPVVAWAVDADLTRLTLLSPHGISASAAERLQSEMRSIRRLSAGGSEAKTRLAESVTRLISVDTAMIIDASDAVVLLGGESPEITAAVQFIQPMLKDVLRRLGILALADLQHQRLDLGISWTAHELRGPLTGTRAVIDLLLQTADEESRTQHLLKRSREDLDRMSALVDGALRVTMTNESLVQKATPLMRIVQDAINMCRAERANVDIAVRNESEVILLADPPHLIGAMANVLRNSLWHSPPESPVEIDVIPRGATVQIRITDQGPRVSGPDREMIFDPFGRGESPRAVGRGKGLGLFIARRVIESHGGTIKVGSSSSGAMFVIELPVAEERRQASAS